MIQAGICPSNIQKETCHVASSFPPNHRTRGMHLSRLERAAPEHVCHWLQVKAQPWVVCRHMTYNAHTHDVCLGMLLLHSVPNCFRSLCLQLALKLKRAHGQPLSTRTNLENNGGLRRMAAGDAGYRVENPAMLQTRQ